jgi:hypothetical protein
MAQSYQNFEGNPEAAAPAGSYDDRLPTQYGREEAYQAQAPQGGAPDAEDGFHPTTVRSILRYVEIVRVPRGRARAHTRAQTHTHTHTLTLTLPRPLSPRRRCSR